MTIVDDYFNYYKKYKKIYGNKTVILMQVGSFFELYETTKSDSITNIKNVAELLNIHVTRRSKDEAFMAGFPEFSLTKYIQLLVDYKYIVVLIEQTTPPPHPKREVTEIFSPSTYIEGIKKSDNNFILSIYLEKSIYKEKNNYMLSLSLIDYSTGTTKIFQNQFLNSNIQVVYENMYRHLESYNPSEILFYYVCLNDFEERFIKSNLDNDSRLLHIYNKEPNKEFFKASYQNDFLNKIYKIESMLNPIEYLYLEYYQYAIVSLILLINFTENHNNNIIKNLNYPEIINENNNLILYNDAMYQLNILHHHKQGKINSLYDILNQYNYTSIGKRLLKERLLHPNTNIQKLNKYYETIESCLNMTYITNCNNILKEIVDIERLQRRIALTSITPYEYYNLSNSYISILKLYKIINQTLKQYITDDSIKKLEELKESNEKIFNYNELSKYTQNNIESNIFNEGCYPIIDNYIVELNYIYEYFKNEAKKLSQFIEKGSEFVKYDNTEKEGYYFTTTVKRYEVMKKDVDNDYKVKKNNNTVKLFNKTLKDYSNQILYLKENIKKESKKIFCGIIENIYKDYKCIFNELVEFIGLVDISINNARLSLELNYNKPNIIEKEDSYVEFKELRHPIIEYISDEKYIGNDVSLGNNNNNILLYGINGIGKSSLSKSIAINIILAQAGLFVCCDTMTYCPFHHIFARINANDNLFKNQSTFVVEMMDLKSILKFCDNKSLMIGDEICKGTEEFSSLSLITSTIKRMNLKKTNFILATHFHQLHENPLLLKDCEVCFKHLTVEFGDENIIYNRKLKDGVGDNLYGIEVAKYILDDKEFMNDCYEVRNILLNKSEHSILEPKKSNYNNTLYMNECAICQSKDQLDTHHIKEQHLFEEYAFEKNKKDNLVVLCKKCHDNVHHGNLVINGYKNGPSGKILDYYNEGTKKVQNKKYGVDQISIIKKMSNEKRQRK